MERRRHDDDINLISKRRRLDSPITAGDTSNEVYSKIGQFRDDVVYRLYFKGLVNYETMWGGGEITVKAAFGVAICDEMDNSLAEIKEPVNYPEISRKTVEMIALIRGLSESLDLGIRNVVIYCEDYKIYQFMNGRGQTKVEIVTLVKEVIRLRQKMASSEVVFTARNDVKIAFRLAKEAIVSQISSSLDVKAKKEEICVICLEETKADHMFFTNKCPHRYCNSCVKQFVEVKLLSGVVPKCLDYECKVELTLESCSKVLTSKLIEMWKQKIKEDSIPAAEKIYCPYPSCSVLMSRTELWRLGDKSNIRSCVKCCGLFCVDCKVPSHSGVSCADYKKLHSDDFVDDLKLKSLANENQWRQCVKCGYLIERSSGCYHMTCRCTYEFCYTCGTKWDKNRRTCVSGCLLMDDGDYDESESESEDEDEDEDEDDIDDEEEEDEDDYDDDEEHECEEGMCDCYYDEDGVRWIDEEEFLEFKA